MILEAFSIFENILNNKMIVFNTATCTSSSYLMYSRIVGLVELDACSALVAHTILQRSYVEIVLHGLKVVLKLVERCTDPSFLTTVVVHHIFTG